MNFWKKKIINFEDRYFGLDLSDSSVKIFQLEKNGEVDKIRSYGLANIPAGYIKDGRIINKEKVSEIIKKLIKKVGPKKINTKKVIASIPESKVFLRIVSIPKIDESESQEAVKWEVEASTPLSLDQIYYDWQFLNQENGKQNVLTVAVAREVADDLIEVLEKAGLDVYGLEMESIAIARSLIKKNAEMEEVTLIIDLGTEKTGFIITEGVIPYFTSSIPFSSAGIIDAISKILNVTKEEAKKERDIQGIEHSFENDSIFNAMKSLLENLAIEIEKTIDFYKNMSKNSAKVEKIIISGGGANLKGLIPYLTARLLREVLVGDTWINLNLGKNLPIISREDSVRYNGVIGLAMREI